MRWFFDTEFAENGSTIKLISIGMVSEFGHGYYAIASDGWTEDDCDDWVKANVLPRLELKTRRTDLRQHKTRAEIAADLRRLLLEDHSDPELWAYYADYDWVAFCQLFGRMIDLPKGMPMYCRDLKQEMDRLGIHRSELSENSGEHNAFADALWLRQAYAEVMERSRAARFAETSTKQYADDPPIDLDL